MILSSNMRGMDISMKALSGTLARSTIANNVLQQIREDIILKKYEPGTKITEMTIAENYKVSRSSVRPVIQQIDREGLIITLENGSKQITGFEKRDAENIYGLRYYLELTAIKTIAQSDQKNYAPMIILLSDLENGANSENDAILDDINFHRAIVSMANNSYILSAYDTIAPTLYTIFKLSIITYKDDYFSSFFKNHNDLIKSLISDPHDKIIEMFTAHLDNALQKTLLFIDKRDKGELKMI